MDTPKKLVGPSIKSTTHNKCAKKSQRDSKSMLYKMFFIDMID